MSQNFNVGGVPLNPKKITKPFLREMWKAANDAEVTEGKKEALEAIETLGKTGEMTTEQYEHLDSYRKGVFGEYRKDKDAMWQAWKDNGRNWKDPKIDEIKKEMGVSGEFLSKDNTFQTELPTGTQILKCQCGPNLGM